MANKTATRMLVPWFNKAEWSYVYGLIYSDDEGKAKALEIIKLWKMRVPKLSSGVEGTLIILEALLQDTSLTSEENLCLLYGTSLMRFLNICGAYTDKQESFYKIAKKNKLPSWLIDLRNDIAHDQKVPSLYLLKYSLNYCLDWLKKTYWTKQEKMMEDYIRLNEGDTRKLRLQTATSLYCKLSDFVRAFPSCDTLQEALSSDEEIFNKLNDLRYGESASKNLKITKVFEHLLNIIKKCLSTRRSKANVELVIDTLLAEGSLFTFTEFFSQEDFENLEIPDESIKHWKPLIELLYKEDALNVFVQKLVKYCYDIGKQTNLRLAVSLWLKEFFKALKKENTEKTEADQERYKETLDFSPCSVQVVEGLKSLQQQILSNPHEFSLVFMQPFLELCQYPQEFINDSIEAVKRFTVPRSNTVESGQGFLQEFEEYFSDEDISSLFLQKVDLEENISNETENEGKITKRWKRVKDVSIFEGCPLGILSHQSRENNPLLVTSCIVST